MVNQVVRLLKLVFRFVFNPNTYSTDTLASSGDAPSKIGQSLSEAISYQVRCPLPPATALREPYSRVPARDNGLLGACAYRNTEPLFLPIQVIRDKTVVRF